MAKLGYDNLPTLAVWQIGSYVSLSADQRLAATQKIEAVQAWHRKTQIPDYIELLRSIQGQVAAGPVTDQQVRQWRLDVTARWRPVAEQAAPGVVEVAQTLQPEQLARMRGELDRGNDKLRREWLPAGRDKRIEARARRYIERAEFFLGDVTDEQKRLARQMAADAPDGEEAWMARRVARQQDFVGLLDKVRVQPPGSPDATRAMREHLVRYWTTDESSARAAQAPVTFLRAANAAAVPTLTLEQSMAHGDAVTAAMLARATPAQRKVLQGKLQDWIDALQLIAR
jgi:hypothetical protein